MRLLKFLTLVAVAVWLGIAVGPDSKLHVIMCNVGQGDAILIYRGSTQLLVDGGPSGQRMSECLSRHMPFYDRKIELVVATHPELDHIGGLVEVVKRYTVLQFVGVPVGKQSKVFEDLIGELRVKNVKTSNVYTGDVVKFGEVEFETVWPTYEFVAFNTAPSQNLTLNPSPDPGEGNLNGGILGLSTSAEINDFSIGGVLKYGEFEVMLTGDADQRILPEQMDTGRLRPVEVLKVPHHGSKFGMTKEWLAVVRPMLAVISVGKNSYGHPTEEAMKLLRDLDIRILRTDQEGDVEIVSDGKVWWVK